MNEAMSELDALIELQKTVAKARARGEKLMQGFWQVTVFFACLGFVWLFLFHLTHPDTGINNLPFVVIGVFGLAVIAILVGGDVIFFNRIYDQEHELEQRQSALAAQILGLTKTSVFLRFAAAKHFYLLTLTEKKEAFVGDRISLESQTRSLTFQLDVESFEEVIGLLTRNREQIIELSR
jgi:hypothetical protein